MHRFRLGVLIVCGVLVCGRPVGAVLVDKILAVVNGELLTLQDFENYLALTKIYQLGAADVDRPQAFRHFVDQTLLRQEASRTRIIQVDEAEVSQLFGELNQQTERGQGLASVMQERRLSWYHVRAWLRHQLIVRAFIDRRVRLFVRVHDNQIVQYYRDHQQTLGEPLNEAVRAHIQRVLTEHEVNARLAGLIEELRRKGSLDFPP